MTKTLIPRRILCLWFTNLPVDRFIRQDCTTPAEKEAFTSGPFALVESRGNMLCLAALNPKARRLGLLPGMSLATARAMHPHLLVRPHSPQKDRESLIHLCDWSLRYTPFVGLCETDGLFLDVSGAAHLLGGEEKLLADVLARLGKLGFHARGAIAPTPGAAWALAHFSHETIAGTEEVKKHLPSLPLAGLRLLDETLRALSEVGLYRIGDILSLPRANLAARFGNVLLTRLDQALGHIKETITPRLYVPPFIVEKTLHEPLTREEDILSLICALGVPLCRMLEERGQGARRVQALLFRVDGDVAFLEVGTGRPLRNPVRLSRLFSDKLASLGEECDAGFGFEKIRLSVLHAEAFETQTGSFATGEDDGLTELVDRLSTRLGRQRVLRFHLQDTHIPEYAMALLPAQEKVGQKANRTDTQESLAALRPLRLFDKPCPIEALAEIPDGPPVRFRFNRILHDVALAEGPERISMQWWKDDKGRVLTRDYFRVESRTGTRLWLYRDGLYGRETARPQWFVHGVFA